MPELGLKTETKLGVKTRLETLYYFVYEMAQGFGVNDDALDDITKGILNRRILSEVIIKYYDNNNIVVGRVTIKINWEKHELLASTDYGASFTLDASKSVRSQVSKVSDIIIEHVSNMRTALRITKIKTSYQYINEIQSDHDKYQEAMRYMGHHIDEKDKVAITKDFTSSLEWLCDKLKEIKIVVEHS